MLRIATSMRPELDPKPPHSEFLEALFHRQVPGRDVMVRTFYPNLALSTAEHSRIVVFSHGHFVESIYMLVSEFEDMLLPARRGAARG